jgi:hypothetical protein
MLGVGLVAGVVIGRSLKRCEVAAKGATSKDVIVGLSGLGSKVVGLFDDDDDDAKAGAGKLTWYGSAAA